MLKHKYLGCPYKAECKVRYRNEFYCGTAKHLKCIEFQVLRDKENKGKCSECGGSRYLSKLSVYGEMFLHKDGCSKSVTTTTGVSMNDYYNKNE
ncbi:hypothetical protein ES708_07781 [subsurface metagenome]